MFSDSEKMEPGEMQNHALFVSSQSKKDTSTKSITLKWVNDKIVDVFRGQGWDNWSRFERRGNHFKMLDGQPLTTQEYLELKGLHESY